VIVNADDFGLDERTNAAVVAAFRQGLVSSTTLIANGVGFQEAVEMGHEIRLARHLGAHLVLTVGTPLTHRIRHLPRFCDPDGRFSSREHGFALRISSDERHAVLEELGAQLERIRQAGFPITHVDSHHHVHTEWAIGGCVLEVCRALGIRRVRLARNCGRRVGLVRAVYKAAYNRRLRAAGQAGSRWFGSVEDWVHLAERRDASTVDDAEVMTHPTLDHDGALVEAGSARVPFAQHLAPLARHLPGISHAGAQYDAGRVLRS